MFRINKLKNYFFLDRWVRSIAARNIGGHTHCLAASSSLPPSLKALVPVPAVWGSASVRLGAGWEKAAFGAVCCGGEVQAGAGDRRDCWWTDIGCRSDVAPISAMALVTAITGSGSNW